MFKPKPHNPAWPALAQRARDLREELKRLADDMSLAGVNHRYPLSLWRKAEHLDLIAADIEQEHHHRRVAQSTAATHAR